MSFPQGKYIQECEKLIVLRNFIRRDLAGDYFGEDGHELRFEGLGLKVKLVCFIKKVFVVTKTFFSCLACIKQSGGDSFDFKFQHTGGGLYFGCFANYFTQNAFTDG